MDESRLADLIYGYTMQLSIEQWQMEELREHTVEVMRRSCDDKIADEGYERVGEYAFLEPEFFRWVKVQHHRHGWQMERVLCAENEAEGVLLHMEATCTPRERANEEASG